MQTARPGARIAFLDALRILASYLVIVCHTICYIPLADISPSQRLFTFFMQSASKIAVPLFLMISGCTLLRKQDSLRKTLSRFLRILLVLILFSLPYVLRSGRRADPVHYLLAIYEAPVTNAYWYLYAYAGLLLMLPFLQKLVQALTRKDFLFFFSVSILVYGLWPMVVEYTPLSDYTAHFALPLFGTHICYLFLGDALLRLPREKLRAVPLALLFALGIAVNALLTAHDYVSTDGQRYLFMDNIAFLPMLLASACAFLLLRLASFSPRGARVASRLGRCAFGVYLLSDLFLDLLFPIYIALRDISGPLCGVMLYQLIVFAVSLACAAVMTRIPLLRRLV